MRRLLSRLYLPSLPASSRTKTSRNGKTYPSETGQQMLESPQSDSNHAPERHGSNQAASIPPDPSFLRRGLRWDRTSSADEMHSDATFIHGSIPAEHPSACGDHPDDPGSRDRCCSLEGTSSGRRNRIAHQSVRCDVRSFEWELRVEMVRGRSSGSTRSIPSYLHEGAAQLDTVPGTERRDR